MLNKNEIAKNISISTTAIDNYIYFALKSFHIVLIQPFFKNKQKEIIKMPKIYFLDTGIRNFIVKDFRNLENREKVKGHLLENLFLLKFLSNGIDIDEIKFWRTKNGREIDFVINDNKAYEIVYNCNIKNEKEKNIKSFLKIFPEIETKILCKDDLITF